MSRSCLGRSGENPSLSARERREESKFRSLREAFPTARTLMSVNHRRNPLSLRNIRVYACRYASMLGLHVEVGALIIASLRVAAAQRAACSVYIISLC